MPEGPTLKILHEETAHFEGHKVLEAIGNAKIDIDRLNGKKVISLKTWGKHFLMSFDGFYVRVHFLMFGSYSVDHRKEKRLIRLGLRFSNGELNFYASHVKLVEGTISEDYDFTADVMNAKWDENKARKKLRVAPENMICDALLDQEIFAGIGNIIKCEVLYRARIHPESQTGKIPSAKKKKLLEEVVAYAQEFLRLKKKGQLKRNWQVYTKKKCERCDLPIVKKETGKGKRRSFFCTNCQIKY
ncbi:DNA-formamidopyrimidine glycosylase family protein [Flavobacterium selenitireducens]|uniref:DNA-formamidopyrimidine glycosylase family protein n=1 Tax=Flavobacterium selenitireducens TaxID=2722704 RepID=UPI00168A6133|nr:DNA-formamidopyrimidine glycosylase family protein [Flavobacterium selenitireducens]MBD3581347.1 endonuclease [Flavobacterium selenitireducens]